VINDGINAYVYDAEGRLCAAENILAGSATQYVYDAAGTRVAKGSISTFPASGSTCAAPTGSGFTLASKYLLGLGDDQVTELNTLLTGTMAWAHSNVWVGSHLTATLDMDTTSLAPALHFHLSDPLGTRRVQTDPFGNVESYSQSLPFGDGFSVNPTNASTADDSTENHFTGKERDTESGNDYFEARYYSSAMGRFMSPDWSAKEEPVPYAQLDDPQSLNLYSYVRNNPLTRVDADGHCVEDLCIGETILAAVVIHAAIATTAAIIASPAYQENSRQLANSLSKLGDKLGSMFSKNAPDPGKPGTRGKPDHQATAAEEADKIGGKTEVRIPTPGGAKETRVGDAVATDANGKPTAVTQVIRPTPAGNVPLREQKAAQDIENATGVKPKLVPVRPLPQQ